MSIHFSQHVDLTSYNTLALPSIAPLFAEIRQKEQLVELYKNGFFKENEPFVLGGGSNVLLKNNLSRPVLKMAISGANILKEDIENIWVEAGAGENWHQLVEWCVEKNIAGIENLALIPGTTGAAPIQNIGAYGVELNMVFDHLELFDIRDGAFKIYRGEDCNFAYRYSIFKGPLKGKVIITKVVLQLNQAKNYTPNTSYHALRQYLTDHKIHKPGIRDVFDAVVAIRRSKLPDPSLLGNAGSFFKNPVTDHTTLDRIRREHEDIPFYNMEQNQVKIPAAWLIEKAGWKGKVSGNVGTYKNQALVIVNFGGATGEEVLAHAMNIKQSVREKFGIELEPEVNIVE